LNKQRLTINVTITATLAIIFGTALTTTNRAWADNISCPNAPPVYNFKVCLGTNDSDNKIGNASGDHANRTPVKDQVDRFSGNDLIFGDRHDNTIGGGSGNDDMNGLVGNDNITGTSGDDLIVGSGGADTIEGASGNDAIYQAEVSGATDPDGYKDELHCGPGKDKVWINKIDGDTADKSCEIVHTK
jgi:Ca2+-binding RTX toxin-like protein